MPSEGLNASKNLYILGYPIGRFQEIKQMGVLKADSFFTDSSDSSGARGGPVLNELHQLVGVFNLYTNNLLFFISVYILKSFIELEGCKSWNVKECFIFSREIFKKSKQEAKGIRDKG